MKYINLLTSKVYILLGVMTILSFNSCGSFQYASVHNDGIYEEEASEVVIIDKTEDNNSDYYTNFFRERSDEVDFSSETEEVFTDVESYESNTNSAQRNGNWGEDNTNVTVNYYNNGWNNNGWDNTRWNNWGWNRGFYSSWAYGFNNWGWNRGFYNAWNNPYTCGVFYRNHYYGGDNWNYNRNGYAYNNGYRNNARTRNSYLVGKNRNNGLTKRPRATSSTPRTRGTNSTRPRTSTPRTTTRPRTSTPRTTTRPRTSTPRTTTRPRTSTPRTTTRPRTSTPRTTTRPRTSGSSRISTRRPR